MKEVLDKLEREVKDGTVGIEKFLNGTTVLSDRVEWVITKDKVFDELVRPNSDIDDEAASLLTLLLPSLGVLFREHFSIQIEMSQKSAADKEKAKESSKSCIKHNMPCERLFAYVDFLIKNKCPIKNRLKQVNPRT